MYVHTLYLQLARIAIQCTEQRDKNCARRPTAVRLIGVPRGLWCNGLGERLLDFRMSRVQYQGTVSRTIQCSTHRFERNLHKIILIAISLRKISCSYAHMRDYDMEPDLLLFNVLHSERDSRLDLLYTPPIPLYFQLPFRLFMYIYLTIRKVNFHLAQTTYRLRNSKRKSRLITYKLQTSTAGC